MDAGVIVAIVVGALILLALFALLGRKSRERRHEVRRHEAREIRREAEVRTAEADQMEAEAQERAARARREEAEARQQAARAGEHRREAEEIHERAHDRDPDTKGDYVPGSHHDEGVMAGSGAGEHDLDRTARTDTDDDRSLKEKLTGRDDAEYSERRFVREGDPNDPDAVREERVQGQRVDR